MSLENNIERIATALEVIAQALTAGANTTIKQAGAGEDDVKTPKTQDKKPRKQKKADNKPSDSDESGSSVDSSGDVSEETEEAVTEEAVTEEAVTEEAVTEEAVTEEAVTADMLRDLAQQALKAGKKDECKAIINSTGHPNISSLPEEDLQTVYAALKALVGE